jgi:hypothetical protein
MLPTSRRAQGPVVQDEKLSALQGKLCVRSAVVIAKFDFIGIFVRLDNRSDLAAYQLLTGNVLEQGDNIQNFWLFLGHCHHHHFT